MKQNNKEAIALTYNAQEARAPVVVAKGKGEIAEKIVSLASHHDIPVQEDASLVHLLSKLEIGEGIPEELYEVVAELFAFIYQLDKEAEKKT
jgi:flagellar biosynthesis protein